MRALSILTRLVAGVVLCVQIGRASGVLLRSVPTASLSNKFIFQSPHNKRKDTPPPNTDNKSLTPAPDRSPKPANPFSNLPTPTGSGGGGDSLLPYDPPTLKVLSGEKVFVGRELQYANAIFGYEAATKYTLRGQSGELLGFVAEEAGSFGNAIIRNMAHHHRSFKATVMDADFNVVFKVDRPFYFIESGMKVLDRNDQVIGEIKMDWHLMRRKYSLFLADPTTQQSQPQQQKVFNQIAAVDMPMLSWNFDIHNAEGEKLAVVDRNFTGWAREIFADAGKYVLHFGASINDQPSVAYIPPADPKAASGGGLTESQRAEEQHKLALIEQKMAEKIHDSKQKALITTTDRDSDSHSQQPVTTNANVDLNAVTHEALQYGLDGRRLTLDERAIALALAIAVDFDYFSRSDKGIGGMFWPVRIHYRAITISLCFVRMLTRAGGGGGGGVVCCNESSDADAVSAHTSCTRTGRWW